MEEDGGGCLRGGGGQHTRGCLGGLDLKFYNFWGKNVNFRKFWAKM